MQFYRHRFFPTINRTNTVGGNRYAELKCFVCAKKVYEYAYLGELKYLQQNICVGICTKQCFDIYRLTPMILDDYLRYFGHIRTKKRSPNRYIYAV